MVDKPLKWDESEDGEGQALRRMPTFSSRRKRVMVIDDDRSWLSIAEGYLQDRYEVTCVRSPTEAVELMPTLRPHLLLLDLNMPGMKGQEILARVRVDMPNLPVIIVSAMDEAETAIACMRSGAKDYLIKPVPGDELRERVAGALREYGEGSMRTLYRRVKRLPQLKEAADILVEEALRRAGGKQSDAARLLGVSQQAISHRVRRRRKDDDDD